MCTPQGEERPASPLEAAGDRALLSVRDPQGCPGGSASGRTEHARRGPPARPRLRGPHSPRPRQPSAPSQLSRTAQSSPSSVGGRSNRSVCGVSAPRAPELPAVAAQAMARPPETGASRRRDAEPGPLRAREVRFHNRGNPASTTAPKRQNLLSPTRGGPHMTQSAARQRCPCGRLAWPRGVSASARSFSRAFSFEQSFRCSGFGT